jgi:acyl-CoA thioesterase I
MLIFVRPRSYGTKGKLVQPRVWARAFTIVCAVLFAGQSPAMAADRPVKLTVLGDSLSAGFGLPAPAAFPARLEQALKAKGVAVEIHNAGVSGDTVAGGLARLDWSIPQGTDAVIVELGANDALRGIDPKVTRAGLDSILRRLKTRGLAVLLAGMRAPRNLGPDYAREFDRIFPELAAAHDVILYPFFLEGIATNAKFNLADGLHPNQAGVDVIVQGILPQVEQLIAGVRRN